MFIQEIIVEGFKSYANRTVISGFDPAFNAITGLNGSGKSNVLDAICFVLGISNLSQVRCASMIRETDSWLNGAMKLYRSEQATCKTWYTSRGRLE